jgi:hypothetical protein
MAVGEFICQGGYGTVISLLGAHPGLFLDAFYGRGEALGCLEDAICGHDFRDRNGMVFVIERVAKQ